APRPSSERWWRRWRPLAARSRPGGPWIHSTSCPARGRSSPTSRRASSSASPARACPRHAARGSRLTATVPACSRSTTRSTRRSPPGFGARVLARVARGPAAFEEYNPNYIGGDINGGVQDLTQLFARPTSWRRPYETGISGLFLCSSSTPPGGGVHGMCGYHAAKTALEDVFDIPMRRVLELAAPAHVRQAPPIPGRHDAPSPAPLEFAECIVRAR